jgi:hypothetical protein
MRHFLRTGLANSPTRATNISSRPRFFSVARPRHSGLENIFTSSIEGVSVSSVSPTGIHLSDGLFITSACIFLGGKALLWRVPSTLWDGWTPEAFQVLEVVAPRPGESNASSYIHAAANLHSEILIIGTGTSVLPPPPDIRKYIQQLGVGLEIMDTVSLLLIDISVLIDIREMQLRRITSSQRKVGEWQLLSCHFETSAPPNRLSQTFFHAVSICKQHRESS